MAEVAVILTDVIGRAAGVPLYGSQDLDHHDDGLCRVLAAWRCATGPAGTLPSTFSSVSSQIASTERSMRCLPPLGAIIFLAIAWTVYESAKLSVMLNLATNLLRPAKGLVSVGAVRSGSHDVPRAWHCAPSNLAFQVAMYAMTGSCDEPNDNRRNRIWLHCSCCCPDTCPRRLRDVCGGFLRHCQPAWYKCRDQPAGVRDIYPRIIPGTGGHPALHPDGQRRLGHRDEPAAL